VGPRAAVDEVEKRKFLTLPRLELRPLGRPACNQSLCRLRYPGNVLHILKLSSQADYYEDYCSLEYDTV
jgi:hypothetical protein